MSPCRRGGGRRGVHRGLELVELLLRDEAPGPKGRGGGVGGRGGRCPGAVREDFFCVSAQEGDAVVVLGLAVFGFGWFFFFVGGAGEKRREGGVRERRSRSRGLTKSECFSRCRLSSFPLFSPFSPRHVYHVDAALAPVAAAVGHSSKKKEKRTRTRRIERRNEGN